MISEFEVLLLCDRRPLLNSSQIFVIALFFNFLENCASAAAAAEGVMKVCLGEKMLNYTLNFDNEMSKQWCIDKRRADGVVVSQDQFFRVRSTPMRSRSSSDEPCPSVPAATQLAGNPKRTGYIKIYMAK